MIPIVDTKQTIRSLGYGVGEYAGLLTEIEDFEDFYGLNVTVEILEAILQVLKSV